MQCGRLLAAIALLFAACAPASVPASPSATTVISTVPPANASPAASPSPGGTRAYAIVCGTIRDFVRDTSQTDGSLVLQSPGRDALKVTIPAGRLGGQAANYVCVQVQRGNPYPLFDGFVPGGVAIFVSEGTVPATSASPAPVGFVLPQACAFVATPSIALAQTDWWIDCGQAKDRDIRGTLAPDLVRQGWTSCGSGLAAAQWRKGNAALVLSESSLAPGDYPRLTQPPGALAGC